MKEQPDLFAKFAQRIPIGRDAEPKDMTPIIASLTSDDARLVTGVNLSVDRGLSAVDGQPTLS